MAANFFKNGLPIICDNTYSFNCFLGFVHGSLEVKIYDQGTSEFPSVITVKTNLGGGSVDHTFKGNENFNQSIKGIDVSGKITDWRADADTLAFHAKVEAKKGIFSCTVLDTNIHATRHSDERTNAMLADLSGKLESESKR